MFKLIFHTHIHKLVSMSDNVCSNCFSHKDRNRTHEKKWYDTVLCKHSTHTCTFCTFVSVNERVCVCVHGVCVPTPSYCVPILSKRQKAHLDLVGWKVGLLHRALLVNRGLPPVSKAALLPPLGPPLAWISACPPCLKVPSSANIWNFAS